MPGDEDCLFCSIVAGRIPADLVYEGESIIAFRDINAQAPFHALIVPKRHIPTTNDLTPADRELAGELMTTAAAIAAREGFADTGYRTIMNCNADGGQTVFHLHLHLLGGKRMGGSGF